MKNNFRHIIHSLKLHRTYITVYSLRIIFIIISVSLIMFAGSCSYKVQFSVKPSKIYVGDSAKVVWKIKNPYKIKYISFGNKEEGKLALSGIKYIKPCKDTIINLSIYEKNNTHPSKKFKKKIKVLNPDILEFSAFRDRTDNNKVILSWNVKDFQRLNDKTKYKINIEGYFYDLAPRGSVTIPDLKSSATFTLVMSSPSVVLSKTCFVDGTDLNQRPMIKNDTAIYLLPGDRKIFMKIIETDISNYPDKIRLKVIVYDSLGNFITHLAPPFADTNVCRKYFQRIVDKAKNTVTEPAFEVKEFNNSPDLYDLALVLDYSGSMSSYMDFYEKATCKFIENKYPGDYYSVTKFDHRLAPVCPLKTKAKEIINKTGFKGIDTLGGSTALYAGIDCGLKSLENSHHKRIVMAFTDGYENASFSYFGTYSWDINDMIMNIRKQKATLMLMGLGLTNTVLLNEMAYYSNGEFYYLANPAAITEVYRDLQHNMRTYYEIMFKPLQSESEHQIQLTYFNNKDTTSTTRPMYIGNNIKVDHDLMQFQVDTTAYWYEKDLAKKGYNFVTTPQSLAYFETNEDKINTKYYQQMQKLITYLNENPKTLLRIYGHTDTKGDDNLNDALSKGRAEALKNYLLSKGISNSRIKYYALGSKYPINKNDKAEWAARENRRAEIVIWKK